jgi:hypothetical protein
LLDTIKETVDTAFTQRHSQAQQASNSSDEYKSKLRRYQTTFEPSNEGASGSGVNERQSSKTVKRATKPLGRRIVPPSEYYDTRASRILELR